MFANETPFINEQATGERVLPEKMDLLWENGWRHFATYFFRYSYAFHNGDVRTVTPLRIDLKRFSFSKSQRRNLRRNAHLRTETGPLNISPASNELFEEHRLRFKEGVPYSVNDFVPDRAELSPSDTRQISVFDGELLIAESYFDVGDTAVSGIFAMFDPERLKAGLGIYTLLKEIEFAIENGKRYYYLGYTYDGESFYDYKKRFRATEAFDWKGNWSAV